MAQKKKTALFAPGWLDRQMEAIEKRRGPAVAQRWYVVEVKPAYNHGGYDDVDYPATSKRVSDYFDHPQGADKYMEDYDPDEGNHFVVQSEKMYRVVHEEWHRA